jgi:hypothetical protein
MHLHDSAHYLDMYSANKMQKTRDKQSIHTYPNQLVHTTGYQLPPIACCQKPVVELSASLFSGIV